MQYPYEIYFKSERNNLESDPLFETTYGMLSDDWRERAHAETKQLVVRANRLLDIIEHYGEDFVPLSPPDLLKKQLCFMMQYLIVLNARNVYENFIDTDLDLDIRDLVKRVISS